MLNELYRLISEDILRVEKLLSSMPRKVLGFATPQETFDKLLSNMSIFVHFKVQWADDKKR